MKTLRAFDLTARLALLFEARIRRSIGDAGPLLDEKARGAYRRRLAELRTALGEAQAFNDLAPIMCTQAEIDALTDELTRAVGLGGRDRRAASPVERAAGQRDARDPRHGRVDAIIMRSIGNHDLAPALTP